MQIVPVLDLRDGIVVHARRGDRASYAPLRSSL
ncbi:MAG: histidine biosynthesis protein, partial [Betaproteobacteria bacterium]|nr:histidine biosynthesis protein [Betaproteobacteria bacterium]